METIGSDKMDEKGYTITPMVFLLLIPVIIFAVAFGDIVNEINQYSTLTIGSDVTSGTVSAIYSSLESGASSSARYAACNVSRKVIDKQDFITDSKDYVRSIAVDELNDHVIDTCVKLSNATGRKIYINNVEINISDPNVNYTSTFTDEDIEVTQVDPYGNGDPFGLYVVIKAGVPIKVEQNDQVYEGTLPEIRGYSTLTGIEDPYIWINTNYRDKDIIYEYPHYQENLGVVDYNFDYTVSKSDVKIQYLWDCLNGTDNEQNLSALPQYFPDPNGLSFFERLEGKQLDDTNSETRMSTFIVGDPLWDDHHNTATSALDHEYFAGVSGTKITVGNVNFLDPEGATFYLSQNYKTFLGIESNYPNNVP